MTYLWKCTSCEQYTEVERPMRESGRQPDSQCFNCKEQTWVRVYENPGVLKASYLDGQSRGKDWQDMKRAAKLEVERARSNSQDDKQAMSKEIKDLRTIKK